MEPINVNTKIAQLIKANPDALEAIISIDSKFKKLRNPLLRKVLGSRATIAMASKMAGCSPADFFEKLKPLGFEIDTMVTTEKEDKKEKPEVIRKLKKEDILELDVRKELEDGNDPLKLIMGKIKEVQKNQALKLINSFEPVPLLKLLEKQGFVTYVDFIKADLVETYFFKSSVIESIESGPKKGATDGWEELLKKFEGKLEEVDVRKMSMPQPMHTILERIEELPTDTALFVYHKRIPVFLLPELSELGYDYRIKELSDGEVRLLIFKA